MGIKKATALLEKINNLHKNVEKNTVSSIEQDLMLSYIRQLYEIYLDIRQPEATPPTFETEVIRKTPPPKPKVESTYKPPKVIEIPDSLKEEIKIPEVKTPTPTPPQPAPTVIKSAPVVEKVVTPEPEPINIPTPAAPTVEMGDADLEALFELPKAKELSDRLSASAINDLTRSIALNDKLLFSNELFNGALVTFNEVVRTLNSMPNFGAAKQYLVELAQQNNWTAKSKTESAKAFIKLVHRRFK